MTCTCVHVRTTCTCTCIHVSSCSDLLSDVQISRCELTDDFDEQVFSQSQISFDEFCSNPDMITTGTNTVVKISGKYVTDMYMYMYMYKIEVYAVVKLFILTILPHAITSTVYFIVESWTQLLTVKICTCTLY